MLSRREYTINHSRSNKIQISKPPKGALNPSVTFSLFLEYHANACIVKGNGKKTAILNAKNLLILYTVYNNHPVAAIKLHFNMRKQD